MTSGSRAITRAIPPILISLVFTMAACGSGGPKSSPSSTAPEPVLVDVPPGTVIDLDRADELYRERDYAGALVIYSAAAKNGTTEQKAAGLLATARIQNETGEHDSAARTSLAFLATGPATDQERQARLIAGSALFAQGDMGAARKPLEDYISMDGPASTFAQIYLAQIDSSEGKLDSAASRLGQALKESLPDDSAYQAQLLLAGIEVQRHDGAAAITAYRAAASAAPTDAKAAEALWLLAQNSGDDKAAEDALADLISGYPITDRALEALDDPHIAKNDKVTDVQRATVLLNHRQNDQATTAFEAIVSAAASPPDVALSQYDLGILAERREDWDAAVQHYDASIATEGQGLDDRRAQASWDKGTVFEQQGKVSDAIDAYAAVSSYSPTADRAADGLFRAGHLAFGLGRTSDALSYWSRYRDAVSSADDVSRADYWLADASFADGDSTSGTTYLTQASEGDPLGYFGMRATARLNGETALPDALDVSPPAPDWSRYEVWLADWAGPENPSGTASADALFASDEWRGAVDLLEAGLTDQADALFRLLLSDNAHDAWRTYRLIRAISEYHRPWVTSPAAFGLLHADPPPEALQLMYPIEYWTLVKQEAAANSLSPLLLLALVRQESLYDPGAVSTANALGLTQVVPATAQGIASDLGIKDFKDSDLLTAKTGLKFGAYYLGTTLQGFGGALSPTVAAYNAGPGTAANWWDDAGHDPDAFLESVPYSETRLFVEVVLENYVRYLYAYGVIDTPSLPLS